MTLKFKRNYPLLVMLVSILSFLALTIGNHSIASYTVNFNATETAQWTEALQSDISQFASLFQDSAVQTDSLQP